MTLPARVGVIGCGTISATYLRNLQAFDETEVVFAADLDVARAAARATEFGVPRHGTPDELLADPDVDIVVNLTIPAAHSAVTLQALAAGKHVYTEKPITVTLDEARQVRRAAADAGLRIAGAPETFLGGAIQTCRGLVDDGAIGRPVAASGFMLSGGHESWHPDPGFYYRAGGGPLFDMGPYYLTALVTLLGPIAAVTGMVGAAHAQRVVAKGPKAGEVIDVEVPTHTAGVLQFAAGPIGTLVTSFDTAAGGTPPAIEIYGTEGTLVMPDPNGFGGEVLLRRAGSRDLVPVPLTHAHTKDARGIGVADLARAIAEDRPHRASGDLAIHVLEAMGGIVTAAESGRRYDLESRCERPAPMPAAEGAPA